MDKNNISVLWDVVTPKLYGYLVNTLRDKNVAEDVMQSAWLKAIEALPRFKGSHSEFSSWLFAIARNECRQHWRKSGREIPFDPELHDKEAINPAMENTILIDQMLEQLSHND